MAPPYPLRSRVRFAEEAVRLSGWQQDLDGLYSPSVKTLGVGFYPSLAPRILEREKD